MAMPDSQGYPWNLYLINNVEDILVFQTRKVLNSDNFFHASKNQEMRILLSQMKINCFNNQKYGYLMYSWSDKAFKSSIVNRALPSFAIYNVFSFLATNIVKKVWTLIQCTDSLRIYFRELRKLIFFWRVWKKRCIKSDSSKLWGTRIKWRSRLWLLLLSL